MGAVLDLDDVLTDHACQYVYSTAAGTSGSLSVESSLDGDNWIPLSGSGLSLTASASGSSSFVVQLKPAQYLRVVALMDSGSATVTALLVSRP
jgi:hypothetical protein